MAKFLVVVESPAKAKTINKFLGSNYIVKASNGHVRDLPKGDLGVDVLDNFKPTYVRPREAMKTVKAIKDASDRVDVILLASDPDREGEAIGWHIAELLKPTDKPIQRIVFNEITKRSIQEAAKRPRPIDENLVNAQQARRILDRLVGYKISPLLQSSVQRGLSAGRVQSVAVRMVCDREAIILAFVPVEYWTVDAKLDTPRRDRITVRLNRVKGEKAELSNEAQVKEIIARLETATYRVSKVEQKEVRRYPYPPFITSSLQQEASRKLGFSPRKTMLIAQHLYEGITLGAEGSVGVISYMRTDSTRIAQEALDEVRAYIRQNFAPEMLPAEPNVFKSKKESQDAHEAIRPTAPARTPDSVAAYLDKDELALYTLIWKRFTACQMAPAVLDQTIIDVAAADCELRATGSIMKFPGFTKLYEETVEDGGENGNGTGMLPEVRQGETLDLDSLLPEQHFTKPPARYSEAGLIRALEENGIGRPSTYAPTINTITERGYVAREKGRLKPTELGERVNKLLIENFPDILSIDFTARLEDDLDHVEDGTREWHELLRMFYGDFEKALGAAQRRMVGTLLEDGATCPTCGSPMEARQGRFGVFVACQRYPECKTTRRIERDAPETTNEICEKCGAPMLKRKGRFGQFLSCSKYPECKNTRNLGRNGEQAAPKEPPQKTDQPCPTCGKFLVIRKNRTGEPFYGCSAYPKCKFTKPMELGLKCPKPKCGGRLVPKRGKGRSFIGCDKYPACDYTLSGKPDKESPCPKCHNDWTVIAKARGKAPVRRCPMPGCSYEEDLPVEAESES